MTTKTLTGAYLSGYEVQAPITTLSLTSTAYVGGAGVYSPAAATSAYTIRSDGRIKGAAIGVYLTDGGSVTNGDATHTGALIQGGYGAEIAGAAGTVTNFGTILGATLGGVGVFLESGGRLTNGKSADRTALISARSGVVVEAGASVINNGTIRGGAAPGGAGLVLGKYGAFASNGSPTNAAALIIGNVGAQLYSAATLTNFGTIQSGVSGVAVRLGDPTAKLNAEAGSVFKGAVVGPGLVNVVGGVANLTALQTSGTVKGAGTLALNGGASLLQAGVQLDVAHIVVSGATTVVEILADVAFARTWTQSGGTLSVDAGDYMTFTGAGDTFAGTLTGAGGIRFSGGADTLSGTTLSAAVMVVDGATVTLSGAINLTRTLSVGGHIIVDAGGATLSGGGTFDMGAYSASQMTGASPAATLTNFDKITGSGQLGSGSMTLINGAGGVIDGNDRSRAITINTGANTIANAGVIESTRSGRVTLSSAIANTGFLAVTHGTLTLDGVVTGAGSVRIGGGRADVATSSFTENVAFTFTSGSLVLANSQGYTGQISGFATTGKTSMDLKDIAFVSGTTTASYSGTTASGVLTVTDGTHTANITLIGDYTASTFVVSSDHGGGTNVIDLAAPAEPASIQPLVTAMATFAPPAGAAGHALEPWRPATPTLAARVQSA
jgi:hypothetical protein